MKSALELTHLPNGYSGLSSRSCFLRDIFSVFPSQQGYNSPIVKDEGYPAFLHEALNEGKLSAWIRQELGARAILNHSTDHCKHIRIWSARD